LRSTSSSVSLVFVITTIKFPMNISADDSESLSYESSDDESEWCSEDEPEVEAPETSPGVTTRKYSLRSRQAARQASTPAVPQAIIDAARQRAQRRAQEPSWSERVASARYVAEKKYFPHTDTIFSLLFLLLIESLNAIDLS